MKDIRKHPLRDLRKYNKQPNTHKDFLISSRYQADATFLIRGVRPIITDEVSIYERISPNTRYYSVVPLVEGVATPNGIMTVEEVFRSVPWDKHYNGASCPTVSIPDCIELYDLYLNEYKGDI